MNNSKTSQIEITKLLLIYSKTMFSKAFGDILIFTCTVGAKSVQSAFFFKASSQLTDSIYI